VSSLSDGNLLHGFFTGDVRFLGSTLLHVVASGAIGFALAFSIKYRPPGRIISAALGLILAITLHTAFNLLIIGSTEYGLLATFSLVWVGVVALIAIFEKIKKIHPVRSQSQ